MLCKRFPISNLFNFQFSVFIGLGPAVIVVLAFGGLAYSQTISTTIPAGAYAYSMAVNPVTNKLYVGGGGGTGNVTVIDGATNTATAVAAGGPPTQISVNAVTNMVYAVSPVNNSVTVIDGSTNNAVTLPVGKFPVYAAVNSVTNKVYVSNASSGSVTVIDGATNVTTTITTGGEPESLAVNPKTNKIYVSNGSNITVIDGLTGSLTTVNVGSNPGQVAVNPLTNKVYVACDGVVSVIDGTSNSTTAIPVQANPLTLLVNPVTNKIYLTHGQSSTLTIIDGGTNTTDMLYSAGPSSYKNLAINASSNQVFVTDEFGTITVIDGMTNQMTELSPGVVTAPAYTIAVNPLTYKVYIGSSSGVTVIDGSPNRQSAIPLAYPPAAAAIDSVTNEIYIPSFSGTSTVSIVDGTSGYTSTVPAGSYPSAAVVNPISDKVYIANKGSNDVTVIDGAIHTSATVAVGGGPIAMAVNAVTNKIYVVNADTQTVTVINGADNGTTTVSPGSDPNAIAVNPVTNQIYVTNRSSNNVTVINGATNLTSTVAVGRWPEDIAVNSVTNKIYVANYQDASVTVIDGATQSTSAISVGGTPYRIAVNPLTNKVYVATLNGFTVIDGTTSITTTLAISASLITVDPVSNKIYVVSSSNSPVTVIDGLTNAVSSLPGAWGQVIVNPVTRQIFSTDSTGANLIAFSQKGTQLFPIAPSVPPLPSNSTTTTVPAFTIYPASTIVRPNSAFYQFDTMQGAWTEATGSNGAFTGIPTTLQPGIHTLFFYATDGEESTCGQAALPIVSFINSYTFVVVPTISNIPVSGSPTISNIQALPVGGNSGVISWTTDQPSTSQVVYGTTSSYGSSSPQDTNLVTNHSVTVSGLLAGATYNYSVVSSNANLATTTSPNATVAIAPYVGYVAFWGETSSGVTISWSTDVPASSYVVYGTSSLLGQTSPVQAAPVTGHGAVLTGLSPGTTYYFRAESATAEGNIGASNLYSFTTTGSPVSPGPIVSNVAVTNVTANSVTVTWTTNQSSSSQVNYGPTSAYGSSSQSDSALVTSHSVTLTGLTPGTTYNYDVVSTSGSISASSSNYTFTTASAVPVPPVISNIGTNVTGNSATITWTTDQPSSSQVNYGTTSAYGIASSPDVTLVTSHSVTLNGLNPGTRYNFDVVSESAAGFAIASPNGTFTTTAASATPPYVGYVAFWGVNNSGVTISWSTDVTANTELAYGTTTALGQLTPVQSALTTSHGVVLTGLNSGTTYYFVAQSTGVNGATGYSTSYSFTTTGAPSETAPVISNIQTSVTSNTATITWMTDEASSSQVNYGVTATYTASSTLITALTTSHSVTLTGLMPGTIYNFGVMSANSNATSAMSPNFTFQTSGSAPGPQITNIAVSSITSSAALVTWTTDQAATSQVSYGNSTVSSPGVVTAHAVTLTGLVANTLYLFIVNSSNAAGVSTTSGATTFTTAKIGANEPAISYLAFWGVTSSGVTISWSTDVASSTSVAYGTTTGFGQMSPAPTALTTSHGVTLTNLLPSTTYYFQAQSADVNGNTGYSTTYSFTTLAGPPTVSNVIAAPGTGNTATINWTTSVPANSYVQYGTRPGNYVRYSQQTGLTTTPQCSLPYVPSGTVHYQLVSTDAYGNQYVSPDAAFVEP